MRLVSPVALGLMLALAGGSVATPAFAAKKEKPAEAPKADYSKEFVPVAQEMQKAEQAKDYAALKVAVDKAMPLATTPDDKFLSSYYSYQLAVNTKDTTLQKASIDGMLASGKAPADLAPKLELMAGQFALQGGDTDSAIAHLERAIASGSAAPDVKYLLAESYFSKAVKLGGGKATPQAQPFFAKGLESLQGAVDGLKAAGQPVPAQYYERGAEIARATNSSEAGKWSTASIQQGSSPKGWSSLLNGFQNSNPTLTRGENLDLMRLKAVTGSLLSAPEYGEYVEAAFKSGLPGEIKSVIEKGRASGKLTSTQLQEYYSQASADVPKDKASLPASEASAGKAPTGKPAASTADAYMSYGEYAKAVPLYRTALQKGSVDANEINTRIGIALAMTGDAAGAKTAFEAVTAGGARKSIADYWLLWLSTKQAA